MDGLSLPPSTWDRLPPPNTLFLSVRTCVWACACVQAIPLGLLLFDYCCASRPLSHRSRTSASIYSLRALCVPCLPPFSFFLLPIFLFPLHIFGSGFDHPFPSPLQPQTAPCQRKVFGERPREADERVCKAVGPSKGGQLGSRLE